MKRKLVNRWLIFIAGTIILNLGIIMSTKAGLGVSPIISIAYCLSEIHHLTIGDVTLVMYVVFVVIQLLLHRRAKQKKSVFIMDILQIPVSLAVTRLMNLFAFWLPNLVTDCAGTFWGAIPGRIIFLLAALALTAIGCAMSLSMRLIPNPADGAVQAISDTLRINLGLTKNLFDVTCILISCVICLLSVRHLVGIGPGTILGMLCVGRGVSLFIRHLSGTLQTAAGIQATPAPSGG